MRTGQPVLVADGSLVLTVLSCHPSEGEVVCRIENDCSIGERKNMVSFTIVLYYFGCIIALTTQLPGYSYFVIAIFYYSPRIFHIINVALYIIL